MAADTNYLTTSTLTDFLRTLYSADLMAVARPQLFYQQFADVKREPGTQNAKTVYWTRVWDPPSFIGTLTENDGTVPSGVLDDEQKSVSVYEHGSAKRPLYPVMGRSKLSEFGESLSL